MSDLDGPAGSKKRVAGRQITKDNPDLDDDGSETGTFKRASDEVLATRKIVKVRRSQNQTAGSNPFAALRFVPPSAPSASLLDPSPQPDSSFAKPEVKEGADTDAKQVEGEEIPGIKSENSVDKPNGAEESSDNVGEKSDVPTINYESKVGSIVAEETTELEKTEKDADSVQESVKVKVNEDKSKEDTENTENKPSEDETRTENAHEENAEKGEMENDNKDSAGSKSVGSLSSFKQLSSSQNAFTGLSGTGFGTSSFSFTSIAKDGPAFGAGSGSIFGTGVSNNGSFSWHPPAASSADVTKKSMQEVPIETGEENEKSVFTADSILYEYLYERWTERGKGELKLNVSLTDAQKARLVMRARGNYRLILNASLYPDMTLTNMDKKGITFACINSAGEGKDGFSTFALKFKDSSFVEEFRGAVEAHKGKKSAVVKTPENSPKTYDD